jgi:phosphoenolpyruvate phosphomutase
MIHLVREHERLDIAGVCIEDKTFPKTNSFSKGDQTLVSIQDFVAKLRAAKACRRDPDFNIIARVESFIAGQGVENAIERASAYAEAGADAIVIHSRADTPREIQQFMERWTGSKPIIVIPTTYPSITTSELKAIGVCGVIYANQGLRASIRSIKQIFSELYEADNLTNVHEKIATLDEVFDVQGVSAWDNL